MYWNFIIYSILMNSITGLILRNYRIQQPISPIIQVRKDSFLKYMLFWILILGFLPKVMAINVNEDFGKNIIGFIILVLIFFLFKFIFDCINDDLRENRRQQRRYIEDERTRVQNRHDQIFLIIIAGIVNSVITITFGIIGEIGRSLIRNRRR